MKKLSLLLGISFLMLLAFAHEYVLLAAKYKLQKGDMLELHLFVADGFNIQLERPFQKKNTLRFELITKDNLVDLQKSDSVAFPICNRKVDFTGGGLIHLERDYARIVLPTDKFLAYLKEDHIESIPAKVNRAKAEQRERYTRYLKCLVQSGNDFRDTIYKKITGQNLEIVLLQNPYLLHKGDKLFARIFFMGKPLINKIITARNRIGSQKEITSNAKTNKNGICTFTIVRHGEWFIHLTHMIACADEKDSNWESFWASYSFGVE
jgi:uncharacterized GH25 family protein